MLLFLHYLLSHPSISPGHSNQEGDPAPALQGPPRSSTSAFISHRLIHYLFFIYYPFSTFVDPRFRDLDYLDSHVRGFQSTESWLKIAGLTRRCGDRHFLLTGRGSNNWLVVLRAVPVPC